MSSVRSLAPKAAFLFCLLVFFSSVIAQNPRMVLPIGHTDAVTSASFSPGGKFILSTSKDATARIWDAEKGFLLLTLNRHKDMVFYAEYDPQGKHIATASGDHTSIIWDAISGKMLFELKGHTKPVIFNSFSPDGKKLATASWDSTVRIWETSTGKLLNTVKGSGTVFWDSSGKKIVTLAGREILVYDALSGKLTHKLIGHKRSLVSARFNHDGSKVLSSSWDKTAAIWDINGDSMICQFNGHSRELYDAVFSSSEKMVVTVSGDKMVMVWDAKNGKRIVALKGHSGSPEKAIFSPDEKNIISGAQDKTIKLWNISDSSCLFTLFGHSDWIKTLAFDGSGKKLLTASFDGTARTWDWKGGTPLVVLKGYSIDVNTAFFRNDDKEILSASLQNSWMSRWDATKMILTNVSKPHSDKWLYAARYNGDGSMIVTASADGTAKLIDANKDKESWRLKGHKGKIFFSSFSYDGKKIATASEDNTAKIWDVSTGELLFTLKGHNNYVYMANFSKDGSRIVTASGDNTLRVWDATTGDSLLLLQTTPAAGPVYAAWFLEDDKKIVSVSFFNTTTIWNAITGKEMLVIKDKDYMKYVESAPFAKEIISASFGFNAGIYSTVNGKLLQLFSGHTGIVHTASFSHDGKRVLTGSADNTIRIWNRKSGKELCLALQIDSINYLASIPSGFYQCSPNAAKLLHYVTKDLKVITFEQLDVKYNRPDKVLEAIGSTDTALINSYRKAYEKRIRKLGIDTTAFRDGYSVPEAEFANRDDIEYEQKNGTIQLHIKAVDSTYQLDRFNIWVNEAPLYGQRGISIKKKNTNSIDTSITINLSQGENRIETSITNVNGTESYRMPLYVNYSPAVKQKEMTRFIGIGIDKFTNSQYDLQYSSKDIRDLARKLKEKYKDNIIIDTLFNENVTVSNVKALKQKLQQTSVNDKVIISYSGHGMLSKDSDYYLSTHSVNFQKPEENGLAYDELENLLDSIPARKKLMLIDACHSGEVDKEEGIAMQRMADSLGLTKAKGIILDDSTTQTQHLGLKNSFELMQSLFVNVGKSTGATIISAAAGNQFALERGDLKNGVFTYSILEAMEKNPTIKISQLKKIVGERVEQLTNGMQKPTSRNETIAVDWSLW